jgi:hypothetical protein
VLVKSFQSEKRLGGSAAQVKTDFRLSWDVVARHPLTN